MMAMLPNMSMEELTMPCIFNNQNLTPDEYYQLTHDNPEWFLFHCRAGGYKFEVVNEGLKITPSHAIDDEMRTLLKQHKPSLIKLLQSDS